MDISSNDFARDLIRFIDASPTPFHAVREVKRRLDEAGFHELKESERWALDGKKHYVIRGGSSLIAFVLGSETQPCHSGFKIIGAHTDSPTLKLKPRYRYEQSGCFQFGVEPYGGGIWRTWLDRDLFIAGRVVTQKPDGTISSHLVRLDDMILSIPGQAIHLQRDVNEKGEINSQTDIPPIAALENIENLEQLNKMLLFGPTANRRVTSSSLFLCDTQKGIISGINGEFIRVGRLDDLASCHQALAALIRSEKTPSTCVVSLYDNEEVGSESAQGAGGPFLLNVLERLVETAAGVFRKNDFQRVLSKSFCISADMAHATHPNHMDKHEIRHTIRVGSGPVIKWNADQHYATSDITSAVFYNLCRLSGVKYQVFVSRSDLRCGSTIGPIMATRLGIPVVDVGIPMFAMHSIREQCGVEDHFAMEKVFETFFSRGQEKVIEE